MNTVPYIKDPKDAKIIQDFLSINKLKLYSDDNQNNGKRML